MRQLSGYQVSKNKYHVLLEVTMDEMNKYDDLDKCICTEDKIYHPLEKPYQDLIHRTEKALFKYVDDDEPQLRKIYPYPQKLYFENQYTISEKRLKEILTPKAFKELQSYMRGQTVTEENSIYDWDFLRWIKKKEVID
jgi:hypothetical protein